MCYCRKIIFSCQDLSHWGAPLRKCPQQKGFEKGQDDECFEKWCLPVGTYRLPDACPECAVKRKAEDEERKARIEEWKERDDKAKKRWEEAEEKRKGTLSAFQVKLAEAKKGLEKLEKLEKSGEGVSLGSPSRRSISKDNNSDDEASVKENESRDVEVETLSRGRSPTARSP